VQEKHEKGSRKMTTTANTEQRPGKTIRIILWTLQVFLSLMFGFAGAFKLTTPLGELAARMPWVAAVPDLLVRFIGVAELTGALGLVLPSITRIKPKLTVLAACGLATVMLLATAFHVSRGERKTIVGNLLLASLLLFIAWGRHRRAPIAPRV
jgi:hypothetical protein